jgi:hypothetical protein
MTGASASCKSWIWLGECYRAPTEPATLFPARQAKIELEGARSIKELIRGGCVSAMKVIEPAWDAAPGETCRTHGRRARIR